MHDNGLTLSDNLQIKVMEKDTQSNTSIESGRERDVQFLTQLNEEDTDINKSASVVATALICTLAHTHLQKTQHTCFDGNVVFLSRVTVYIFLLICLQILRSLFHHHICDTLLPRKILVHSNGTIAEERKTTTKRKKKKQAAESKLTIRTVLAGRY